MGYLQSSACFKSNYIRWKLLSVSQNHIYWYQLFFVLRLLFIGAIFGLIAWSWSTFGKMNLVEEKNFAELPTNEDDFVYPKPSNIIDYQFSHPFENSCHFPTLQIEDKSIAHFVEHTRQIVCPQPDFEPLVSQDREGEFLIGHPSGAKLPHSDFNCYYRELGGALWPNISDYKLLGQWRRLPVNRRFRIRKDQFVVKCWSNETKHLVYHNAFANIVPRLSPPDVADRYNIAILQIDSTSRNQFFRHAPKTLQFMKQNGFYILRGYTKIGDNSAINTLALLAGRGFEAKHRALDTLLDSDQYLSENQTFGDIFKHVEFLFDKMKDDGCATMFNDDIGKATGGLFHYQAFNGFHRKPTDFYFRPYYTYIYKELNAQSVCVNGEFLIAKWLNHLWERFSTLYKHKCHFSFNHLSYFTHANGNNLQLYDQPLADALERMKSAGVLDNTVIVILGDHGQRINKIKHTYYGKIEERMPLASIHLPKKFRQSQPKLYENFRKNTNRFTSTFDLHETLKDLVRMGPRERTNSNAKRIGQSLFEEIPANRGCKDAKVPENFCVCMEEHNETMNINALQLEAFGQIRAYLNQTISNLPCKLEWGMETRNQSIPTIFAVTPLVRYGPRYMEQWYKRLKTKPGGGNIFREIVELEQSIVFWVEPHSFNGKKTELEAIFRFQHNRLYNDGLNLLENAWLKSCSVFQLPDLCACLDK